MDRIKEVRERANKATPGPWHTDSVGSESIFGQWVFVGPSEYEDDISSYKSPGVYIYAPDDAPSEEDAEFIAHARDDMPFLLERIDELERENERLRVAATAWMIDYMTTKYDKGPERETRVPEGYELVKSNATPMGYELVKRGA